MTDDSSNPKDKIGSKKVPLSLIPSSALVHLAMVMKNGADKYGAYNWREKKIQAMIYLDAALRHILAYIDGEDCASDSSMDHRAHAMACLAILLDADETGNLKDNRPKKGAASRVLAKFDQSTNNQGDLDDLDPFDFPQCRCVGKVTLRVTGGGGGGGAGGSSPAEPTKINIQSSQTYKDPDYGSDT